MFLGVTSSLISRSDALPPEEVVLGQSEAMRGALGRLEKAATSPFPILIHGEAGSGKEVLARLIHCRSPWRDRPFIKVDCALARREMVEKELFGRGELRPGDCERAGLEEAPPHDATVFLDEVADLESGLQLRLLQLLQEGPPLRIDAQTKQGVGLRLISATCRSLEKEVAAGRLRQDLFYSLNVVNFDLPPLRERTEDIPPLVHYFLDRCRRSYCTQPPSPSEELMEHLERYDWPGNIRELENLMKRYFILGSEEVIRGELGVPGSGGPGPSADGPVSLKGLTRKAIRELERRVILKALQENHWNRKQAARALNISYRALFYKIKDAGLTPSSHGARQEAGQKNSPSPAGPEMLKGNAE